jgi:hypothetical protein
MQLNFVNLNACECHYNAFTMYVCVCVCFRRASIVPQHGPIDKNQLSQDIHEKGTVSDKSEKGITLKAHYASEMLDYNFYFSKTF